MSIPQTAVSNHLPVSPAVDAAPMRAVLQRAYGEPDVLVVGEAPRPVVGDDGVLVKVFAVGLNKGDWHLVTGRPYLIRAAGFGLFKPGRPIPGMAVAGRVEAVGKNVQKIRAGDEVFGELGGGGLAEYVCATELQLAIKPASLSFEETSTLPLSGTTALQALRDAGGLVAGQSVLINGASGGVGSFAVQIARAMGAVVTGVCSTANVELVRSLGADHVVDYTLDDFTRQDRRYDLILDLVGNHTVASCRRVLTEKGKVVAGAGGADREWAGPMVPVLLGLLSNLFAAQKFVPLVAVPKQADLVALRELVEAGKIKPAISRRYPLGEVADAIRALGQGHVQGKSVICL